MAKKISEDEYQMIEARRNLQKGIFIPESMKTLHHMKGLEEKIGCYNSYVYAERLLEYVCKNKTALGAHEIELMFYTMVAYTYADINRGELISRLKTYYKKAVWDMPLFIAVVSVENFISGMATTALVAYISALCNKSYTATQYALLSSVMGASRDIFSSTSGVVAEFLGWKLFFIISALMSLPSLLIIWLCVKDKTQ